mgnify:CR=1 FL=1
MHGTKIVVSSDLDEYAIAEALKQPDIQKRWADDLGLDMPPPGTQCRPICGPASTLFERSARSGGGFLVSASTDPGFRRRTLA